MCGIWVCVGLTRASNCEMYESFMKIAPRGPDKSTFTISGNTAIGFHRLAIRDTTYHGDQPFMLNNTNHELICVCNGEIYEYEKLVEKYNLAGVLQSNSDCEIILHLYLKLGIEKLCQEIMGGEFACVIIDTEANVSNPKQTVYCIRDPIGVRPMFVGYDAHGIIISSELKGIVNLIDGSLINQMPSGSILKYTEKEINVTKYYDNSWPVVYNNDAITNETAFQLVRDSLITSVESMMHSDRPIGALLSGGLDSSLVVSIASNYLRNHNQQLHTFSIGMPGSTDYSYAKMVSDHCNTIHTHIELTTDDFVNAIEDVIYTIESPDITTIRASTGQYLISKIISQKYDVKVLLIGDGSDELLGGYLYFHKAPNIEEFHKENCKLLNELKYYDVLRADRGVADNGLEARVPFLKHTFIDTVMNLPSHFRLPRNNIEKWLLREAFNTTHNPDPTHTPNHTATPTPHLKPYLPKEVLFRRKEAFSDGVSSVENSWYTIIQNYCNTIISDSEFEEEKNNYPGFIPPNKEALYYLRIYCKYYYKSTLHITPRYWLPNWVGNTTEPSARTLTNIF